MSTINVKPEKLFVALMEDSVKYNALCDKRWQEEFEKIKASYYKPRWFGLCVRPEATDKEIERWYDRNHYGYDRWMNKLKMIESWRHHYHKEQKSIIEMADYGIRHNVEFVTVDEKWSHLLNDIH